MNVIITLRVFLITYFNDAESTVKIENAIKYIYITNFNSFNSIFVSISCYFYFPGGWIRTIITIIGYCIKSFRC